MRFGINFTQRTFRFPYVFKVLHGKYLFHETLDYKFSLSFTYIVKECRIFIAEVLRTYIEISKCKQILKFDIDFFFLIFGFGNKAINLDTFYKIKNTKTTVINIITIRYNSICFMTFEIAEIFHIFFKAS